MTNERRVDKTALASFPASGFSTRGPERRAMPDDSTGSVAARAAPYALPRLARGYDDLEPAIDEATMQLHHDQDDPAYGDEIDALTREHTQWDSLSIPELLEDLADLPTEIREAVRNQGGDR